MPAPLPERFKNRAFTVAEAKKAGLTPKRLRGKDLAAPFSHVRAPAHWMTLGTSGTTLAERIEAKRQCVLARASSFLAHVPLPAAYSGGTAAYIHGIPLPLLFLDDERLDISVPKGRSAPRHRGVIGHCITANASDVTVVDGIPVTSLERTWCDLASVLTVPDLVAAGDWLIHRGEGRTTQGALAAAARQYPTTRWRARRSEALDLLNERAESPRESRLRVHLLRAGLPEPEINPSIVYNGVFMGRVDMLFLAWALIVEYEGEQHLTDARQWQKDIERVNDFADIGMRTIRATAADDRDPSRLIERIRGHIAAGESGVARDPAFSIRW